MNLYRSAGIIIVIWLSVCLGCTVETESTTTVTVDTNKAEIYFNNLSDYQVNVYVGMSPYTKFVNCIVPKRGNLTKSFVPSSSLTGDTFYFEYLIPVGDITIPSYSGQAGSGYKTVKLEIGKTTPIQIEKLNKCETECAYLLIENKLQDSVYLSNGSSIAIPIGQSNDDAYIKKGKTAVFEVIEKGSGLLKMDLIDRVKLVVNATEELPLPISSVEKGMIYTMVVTADNVTLKSLTPFNIDIQNQIWYKDIDARTYNVQCVRPNISDGLVVLSTAVSAPNAVICEVLDKYGKTALTETMALSEAKSVKIFDCLYESDGTIVMLLQNELTGGGTESHLFGYDFAQKSLKFDYQFDENYTWVFRGNMQNSICRINDGKYAVVGGRVDADYAMSSFIMTIDTTDKDRLIVNSAYSDVTTDAADGVQMMLTSVYYDGSDYIACGYENCDFAYGDRIHSGVVYRISGDLSSWTAIYRADKTLLFGIVGDDDKYYACGEYADSGSILKGCLVSVNDATSDRQIFTAERSYHWFNQIAVSGDKLLLCGPTSDNRDGSGTAYSVVAAVDKSGKQMWSNTFTDYDDALSCIPNGIGSYIVQLSDSAKQKTTIVSADLLGGNTGKAVK